eukprot:scaffold131237_cov23-Tisochrysis_lutea.AAC.2
MGSQRKSSRQVPLLMALADGVVCAAWALKGGSSRQVSLLMAVAACRSARDTLFPALVLTNECGTVAPCLDCGHHLPFTLHHLP